MRGPAASGLRFGLGTATSTVTSLEGTDEDGVLEDAVRRTLGRTRWARRTVVLVPAALMLCLGLLGLDRRSMWRDDAASLVAARRTLPELKAMLHHVESMHALYDTLLHDWLQLAPGAASAGRSRRRLLSS